MPLREIIALMRRVYCGKVGIEYRFISNPVEKEWIRRRADPLADPLLLGGARDVAVLDADLAAVDAAHHAR